MPYFRYKEKSVFYRDEGKGEPLLILAGNTASSSAHDDDIAFFSGWFRVLCPDYIGYGKSDRVDRFPTDFWAENAEMCAALINYLGLSEVVALLPSLVCGTNLVRPNSHCHRLFS